MATNRSNNVDNVLPKFIANNIEFFGFEFSQIRGSINFPQSFIFFFVNLQFTNRLFQKDLDKKNLKKL